MNETEWEFMKSPWFVPEVDNWHLKDDAPAEVVREFEEYKKYEEQLRKRGINP